MRNISAGGTTITISGKISGSGTLQQTGGGRAILTAVNDYTGGTTVVNGGTVQVGQGGSASAVGNGPVGISGGGTLNLVNVAAGVLGNSITNGVGGLGTVLSTSALSTTLTGTVRNGAAGTIAVTANGTGTLILANAGDTAATAYTGATTVIAGTLQIGTAAPALTGTIGATSAVDVRSNAKLLLVNVQGNSFSNNVTNSLAGSGLVEVNSVNTNVLSGVLSNGGGILSLTQSGLGTTILAGDNTFSGAATISVGVLQVGNGGVSGTAGVGNGQIFNNATLSYFRSDAYSETNLISGTGIVNKNGSNALTLTRANAYDGATNVNAGTLILGNATALGSAVGGTVVANGATLDLNAQTVVGEKLTSIQGAGVGGFALTNTAGAAASFSGDVALGGATTIGGAVNNDITIGGSIGGGAQNLTKAGGDRLILTGVNTYTGTTTVTGGELRVNGVLSSAAVTVQSGATLSGTGNLLGAVTISNGGSLNPGTSPGTITVGSLVLNAASTSNFELATPGVVGGPTNDLVNVTGALTLNGNVNVINGSVAGLSSGSYRLFNYLPGALIIGGLPSTGAGTLTLNGNAASWNAGPTNATPSVITSVAGQVNLLVLPNGVGPVQYWDGTDAVNNNVVGGGNGDWANFSNNWTNGVAIVPPATGIGSVNAGWQNGIAVFGGTTPPVNAAVPAGQVNLIDAVNAQGLVFATSGFSITGAGNNTLTLIYAGAPVVAPFINVVGGQATIDAQIKGNQGLWANGTGTLFLNNVTNSFTGGLRVTNGGAVSVTNDAPLGGPGSGITLNNGTLQVNGDFTLAAARTVTLGTIAGDTGTIDVTGAHTLSIGGVNQITGNGALVKIGTGILNLTGANNYIGTTFISGGTLQVNNDNNLGTVGGITFANNAVLKTTAGITSARAVTLNAGGGTFDSNGFNSTLSNVIGDGAGAPNTAQPFTKAGLGTLLVTAASTYTGQTNVTGGTLQVGNGASALTKIGNNTGNVVVSTGATLGVNLANTGTFANNVNVAAAGTISANNAAGTQTLSGTISGAGFLNQDGLGRTLVSGNNVAFTGLTSVNFGTLIVGNANALGTAGLGQGTVVAGGATLDLNGQAIIGEPVQIQGTGDAGNGYIGVLASHNGAGGPAASLGGQVSLAASASIGNDLTVGGDFTLSGFVSGGAGAALTKVGTNMVTLSAVNSYLGTTTVATGILVAGDASALGNISAGTTVNNGASLMIGNTILTNAEPLTIVGAGAATRAGILLTSGALTQQLNGSSSYNGVITVDPTNIAGGATISTNGTGTFTLNAGIIKNGVVLTLTGGGNIKINNVGISGATSFTSDLVVDGTGTGGLTVVDANVANSYAGPTWITNGGTFNANVLGALPSTAADGLGGIAAIRTTVIMDPVAAIAGSSAPSPSTGSSILNLGANQAIQSLAGAASSMVNLGTKTLTIGTTLGGTTTFAGIISGANLAGASIIKDGTSTQIFSGLNTYTGSTTVNGGTLQAGIITQAFGINSAVTVGAAGTLDIAGFSNTIGSLTGAVGAKVQSTGGVATLTTGALNTPSTDYAGQLLDGAGGQLLLVKNGTGIQVLSGTAANTYTGLTTVNAGELDLNKTAGLNAVGGNLTIGDGAGGANSDIVKLLAANQIIDTSVVLVNGSSGKLDLNNFSETILSFADTGAVAVNGSSVNLGSGTLTFGDGTNTTFSGAITGVGGNLIKNGTGTHTLAGTTTANTFSGLTTVNAGELDLNKTAGTLAIGGNLTIGDGAGGANSDIVKLLQSNQIIDTAVVLVNGTSGKLDLNNQSETIAVIADTGAVAVNGSSVNLGSGTLTFGDGTNRTFSGAITGAGGNLIKNGTGIQTLAGTTTANTFSGLTTVNAGELDLNKTAGTQAIGGNLIIGDGAGPGVVPTASSDIVKLLQANQIIATSLVLINRTTGRLDLNGNSQTVGSIADTGAGTGSTINLGTGTLTTGAGGGANPANPSTAFSGVIGGAGNLTKAGTGIFTLSGLNTYTGSTNVTGTLKAGSTQAFGVNSAVTVNATGTLDLAGNSNSIGSLAGAAGGLVQSTVGAATLTTGGDNTSTAFSGTVQNGTGPLSLTKVGTGTQTLSGTNTYTGPTTVNAGKLLAGSTQAFGVNSATTVNNGGTLDLGGNSNSIGSLAGVAGGTVQNSTATAATLTTGGLNMSTAFSGTITNGAGAPLAFAKNGTGTQTLSGTNSYTGGTTLNAGTLAAGSTKAFGSGNLTVNGGTLQTVGGPRIVNIGGGNIALNGGTTVFNVGGTTAGVTHDQLLTTGTVGTISGNGRLTLVQQNGYLLQPGDKVNLMVAGNVTGGSKNGTALPAGTVIGLSAFSNTPLLVPTVNLYIDPSVTLEAMQGSFAGLNGQSGQGSTIRFTPNQLAVARALDSVAGTIGNKTGIFQEFNFLDTQSLSTLQSNLDKIAPEELTSIFRNSVALANVQSANLQRRMEDIANQSSAMSAAGMAAAGSGPSYSGGLAGPSGKRSKEIVPANNERWGAFLTGTGEFTRVGSTTNAAGYKLDTAGVTAGLDYRLTDHFAIGIDFGYMNTDSRLANGGNINTDGGRLGLYATYFDSGFHMDAAVNGGLNSYSTRRVTPNNTVAIGNPDGSEINVLFATGYDWKLGRLTVGPTASYQFTDTSLDGFTERGAFAPLTIGANSAQSHRTSLGVRAFYDGNIGRFGFRPEVKVSWQHEFDDNSFDITSRFATLGGNPFVVTGPSIGRDSLLINAGFSIMWSSRLSTFVYYDGEVGRSNYDSHSISGGLRLQF